MNNKYIKLIFVLMISYGISLFFLRDLFLADSPQLRLPIHEYLAEKIQGVKESPQYIASLFGYTEPYSPAIAESLSETTEQQQLAKNKENALSKPLQRLVKGVYAQSSGNYSKVTIIENEVEWDIYTTKVKGKEVKIKVMKGEARVTEEELEKLIE